MHYCCTWIGGIVNDGDRSGRLGRSIRGELVKIGFDHLACRTPVCIAKTMIKKDNMVLYIIIIHSVVGRDF